MTLLSSLDLAEFRRFRKLLQSPVYTVNPHHLKLYDALKKHYPTFESPSLTNQRIFEKVFANSSFDDSKLRLLASKFTRLVEDYLLLLEQERDAFERNKRLAKIYSRRNLYSFFEKSTKTLLANLEASPHRDMNYYLQKAQLTEARYFHPMKNKYDLKDTALEDLMDSVDKCFVLAKMRFGIAMKSVERILMKRFDWRFKNAIESEQEGGFMKADILAQLYRLAFQLLEEKEKIDFLEYQKLLFKHLKDLSLNAQLLLFFSGLNYAIRQSNRGLDIFHKITLEWYKIGLKNGLLIQNNKISEVIFGNIVTSGCHQNEFEWVHYFIIHYQQYLPESKRTDVVSYNMGVWYFHQKQYEATLSILKNHSFSKRFQLPVRMTLIKTLFELFLADNSYYEVLISHIDSYTNFTHKNKFFSDSKLELHTGFAKLLHKLANKIIQRDNHSITSKWLLKELESGKKTVSKPWLLEKATLLEKMEIK